MIDVIIRVTGTYSQVMFRGHPESYDEFRLAGYMFCVANKFTSMYPKEINEGLNISKEEILDTYDELMKPEHRIENQDELR